jgi:hypothetical protein
MGGSEVKQALLIVGGLILLSALSFGLSSAGLFGKTVVERKVFENSYQRSESIKSQLATDEATLAEINVMLTNSEMSETTRVNLEAQATAARMRIAAAKGKQK